MYRMKQYWLHTGTVRPNMGNNKEVGSAFYPYPQGTSFTGQIRFTNLSEEELGMLLWSLLLEKESQQNIGKGKPYGYGRIQVSLKELNILDAAALYGSDSLCLEPYQDQKNRCSEYIEKAKQDMTRFLGRDVMTYSPVRDFFWMKNADEIPDDAKTHYMSIDPRYQNNEKLPSEYQERTSKQIPLATIGVVMGMEKGNNSNPGQKKPGSGGKKNENNQNRNENNKNRSGKGNHGSMEYNSGGSAATTLGSRMPKIFNNDNH